MHYPDYIDTQFLNSLHHEGDAEAANYSYYGSIGYTRAAEVRIYRHSRVEGYDVEEVIKKLNGEHHVPADAS